MKDASSRAGSGPAHTGAAEWFTFRVFAVALIPLTLWLLIGLLSVRGGYAEYAAWAAHPVNATALALLLAALAHHVIHGVTEIITDYVHQPCLKTGSYIFVKLACFAWAAAGIFAVLRLALAA